jgi:hypothetical protein
MTSISSHQSCPIYLGRLSLNSHLISKLVQVGLVADSASFAYNCFLEKLFKGSGQYLNNAVQTSSHRILILNFLQLIMASKPFPPVNGMTSFWRSSPGSLDNHRSSETLPSECDILIVGAGFSGGSLVTHMLAQPESKNKSIVIVEARQLCSGATGRNGSWQSFLQSWLVF